MAQNCYVYTINMFRCVIDRLLFIVSQTERSVLPWESEGGNSAGPMDREAQRSISRLMSRGPRAVGQTREQQEQTEKQQTHQKTLTRQINNMEAGSEVTKAGDTQVSRKMGSKRVFYHFVILPALTT